MKSITCNNIIVNGVASEIPLYTTAWKQFSIMEELDIPPQKPDMKRILSINVEVKIINFDVVKTPIVLMNQEGLMNTGYKVVIKGKLNQLIEYATDDCESTTHSAHYEVPFCTYIVLPTTYLPGNAIDINAYIEDIYVNQKDCRTFFKNVTVFVTADVLEGITIM